MNRALAYIEAHLTDEIDYKEAARLAHCSEHHFKRMFSFLAGIPLSEYVRRRRLTLAAMELQDESVRILDAALKYGYESPDAFTRAFAQLHGVTPSEARKRGQSLKAFPRMTFQLTVKGGSEMEYRIVEKDAFRIVGIMRRVPIVFEGVNPAIAEMTGTLTPELIATIKGLSDTQPAGMISASTNFSEERMEEKGELDHYIGAATTQQAPEGLASLEVAAATWAVFTAIGTFPQALQSVWGRIYSEWFPSAGAGYEQAEGPELLWNESPDTSRPDYRSEIWIPVRMKRQG
ncbi:GyrI-like domain-containing protein [Paenibacillus aurantiacus]|uniref:GyrI-like domain-containing protein n=1 Tax=Paenibacillus aurantiacus TaxID=1936118 RepID=A0ABV5KZG6_9BACL